MSECNCTMMQNWDPGVAPCEAKSPDGSRLCTKPEDHIGPHSACSPAEHPAEVWNDE